MYLPWAQIDQDHDSCSPQACFLWLRKAVWVWGMVMSTVVLDSPLIYLLWEIWPVSFLQTWRLKDLCSLLGGISDNPVLLC